MEDLLVAARVGIDRHLVEVSEGCCRSELMRVAGSVGTAKYGKREALLSGGGGRRIGLEVRNVDGGGDDDGMGGKRDDSGILYRPEQCLCCSPDLRLLDSGAIGHPA